MNNKWIFVIDTEDYAGNFERDMCAYITGVVGECEVGEEFAELYFKETGEEESRFIELTESRPDDKGCFRPCVVYPTPGWFNHGLGGHFRDGQEAEALVDYIKVASEYNQKEIDQINKQIIPTLQSGEKYSNWKTTDCNRRIKELEKEIEKIKKTKKVHKYQAYLSVAIFFYTEPTKHEIEFMKERALKFAEAKRKMAEKKDYSWDKKFKLTISGFRLIREATTKEEVCI